MAVKRSAEDLDAKTSRPRRTSVKRTRLSPSAGDRSNSSQPSSCSVSEDSALQSSPPASARDRVSSMSSLESDDSESGSGSSVSSDSDSEASDEEEITALGGPKKPDIHRVQDAGGSDDLRARLATLLPQLEEANNLLASDIGKYRMEDMEDGEQHIEMNLGLGVLEEQEVDDGSSSDDSESSETEEEDDPSAIEKSAKDKETRHLDRLTGNRSEPKCAGIEEVG